MCTHTTNCNSYNCTSIAITAGVYPGFSSRKRIGVYVPPLEGMLVHRTVKFPNAYLMFTGLPNHFPLLTMAESSDSIQ